MNQIQKRSNHKTERKQSPQHHKCQDKQKQASREGIIQTKNDVKAKKSNYFGAIGRESTDSFTGDGGGGASIILGPEKIGLRLIAIIDSSRKDLAGSMAASIQVIRKWLILQIMEKVSKAVKEKMR